MLYLGARGALRALPHTAARPLGRAVGGLAWHLDRRHRRIVLDNLARAFPEWPAARRRQVGRQSVRHFGAMVFDTVSFARFDAVEVCRRLTLVGWENLVEAQERGRGLLLISAHLGNWEMAAHPVALYRGPLHAVARPFDNPWVYRRFAAERERFGQTLVAKQGAAPKLFRVVRGGGTVGLIMDQRVRPGQGILVPFFGHDAWTSHLPAALSLRTGAPAVPLFAYPEPGGRYRVEAAPAIAPPDDAAAGDDDGVAALTARYLAALEAAIRAHPEQWLWMHRRWRLD